MTQPATDACPCGTGKPYAACCEPLLAQKRQAATAEELMRSRFTAHFRKDFAHVHRTFAETASEPYVPDPEQKGMAWTRLVVHSHEPGASADAAFVDFTAYYQEGDKEQALHEKAAFKRIDGVWLYTGPVRQGPAPIKAASSAGRNDPCPCGSGKKYKKCCGK